eukprot:gene10493-19205_t
MSSKGQSVFDTACPNIPEGNGSKLGIIEGWGMHELTFLSQWRPTRYPESQPGICKDRNWRFNTATVVATREYFSPNVTYETVNDGQCTQLQMDKKQKMYLLLILDNVLKESCCAGEGENILDIRQKWNLNMQAGTFWVSGTVNELIFATRILVENNASCVLTETDTNDIHAQCGGNYSGEFCEICRKGYGGLTVRQN